MRKLKKQNGFTLVEMLIVVAIIAVLAAIAIPVFSAQLEKSREATDVANIRAAYAECTAAVLTAPEDVKGYYKDVELRQSDLTGWKIDVSDVAGINLAAPGTGNTDATVNVSKAGVFKVNYGTAASAEADYVACPTD